MATGSILIQDSESVSAKFKVNYEVLTVFDGAVTPATGQLLTKSVCEYGIRLNMPVKTGMDDIVKVEIDMAPGRELIKAHCSPEWCEWNDAEGAYDTGLLFVLITKEDSERFRKVVAGLKK